MIAGFAAALAISTPMAFAANPSPNANAPNAMTPDQAAAPAKTSIGATSIQPDQIRASKLKGSDVYDAKNEKIGSVKDLIIDKRGQVAAMVIDVDDKDVGLAMTDVKITMDKDNNPKVTVDKSRQELKSAQAFQFDNPTATSGSSTAPANRPALPAGNNK